MSDDGDAQLLAELVAPLATRALSRHIVRRLARFEAHLNRRVEAARLDDLLERVHRRLVAEPLEKPVQIVLELVAATALRLPQRVEAVHGDRIDHLGAEIAELAQRPAKYGFDLPV